MKPKITEAEQSRGCIVNIRPMSVNECWQGRRFKTKSYDTYINDLLNILPKREMITGYVEVQITFYFKYPNRRDVDNCIKPLLDIFVKKGYIEDDRKIISLHVKKLKEKIENYYEGFRFEINPVI